MRSSNPILNPKGFAADRTYGAGESMTIQGTVNKTFVLLALVVLTASYVWGKVMQPAPVLDGFEQYGQSQSTAMQNVGPLMMLGVFGGFIAAIVTAFKKEWAPITAPIYAALEGLALGGISAIFEASYPGIVMQAVALTFGTLFCLLVAYKTGLVQVTAKFRMGVFAATGAIALVYLVNMIMGFFGGGISMLSSSSPLGIGISLVIVGIAALNLVLDFDFIEQASSAGMPKYMEWYGAFGLMVTLVWLYMEMLRLLAKMNNRR
ncbi:MAG: Bax inhibitor-1/YccA family protein [Candidatus Omnitrophica bacterium]|nr:Bax inhibitor-1/YccA family protein [Candidatus Omnitrophota bacterium]